MSVLIALTTQADEVAVGAASADFATLAMDTTRQPGLALYQYVANVASWIQQGDAPVATAGAGSMYVPANVPVTLDGSLGAKLAVIEDGAGGKASLTPMMRVA